MKFNIFKKYTRQMGAEPYLDQVVSEAFRRLEKGLMQLSFLENMDIFIAQYNGLKFGQIGSYPNKFGAVPKGRIIIKHTGNGLLTDGDWDRDFVRIINNGYVDVTATVLYFK